MVETHPSDEVDEPLIEHAQDSGDVYRNALEHMIDDVAHTGGIREIQDMVIGFVQEPAEGMYVVNAENELTWREPGDTNCHIAVAVMDADDNRFIPYLDIQITLFDTEDNEYGPFDLPFIWHPGLNHYGRNITLPSDGTYDLRIHVDSPTFNRHDRKNGDRYTRPIEVVFENVDIKTGQA